jgi:hypothetical protein
MWGLMSRGIRASSIALALTGAGCGDPMVNGDYQGEPLLVLHGTVLANYAPEELRWPAGELRLTIDWARWSGDGGRTGYDARDLETVTAFPAEYWLKFYQPPPDAARFTPVWSGGVAIAVGTPLLYIDRDADRQWDYEDDPIVGGSEDQVVVFVAGREPVRDGNLVLQPGFQQMRATIDYCSGEGAEGATDFRVSDGGPVNLLVGDLWDEILDWYCGPNH